MTDSGESKPASRKSSRPKKKTPSHFKPGGTSLVENLLAGADDVAGRSFLGGGNVAESSSASSTTQPTPARAESSDRTAEHSGPRIGETPSARVESPAPTPDVTAVVAPEPAVAPEPSQPAAAKAEADTSPLPRQGRVEAAANAPAVKKVEEGSTGTEAEVSPPSVASADFEGPAPDRHPDPSQTASRTASSTGRRGRGARWAHEAIHESFADAKIRSAQWKSHGFRIEPETLDRLKERLKADRRTSGNVMLGQSHYLDAALRNMPVAVETQIAMADDFLNDRMGIVAPGKQSTYRMGTAAFAFISTLNQVLQEADYGRRGLYIVSAALERLLDDLDKEGDLPPPARRKRGGTGTRG
ncbi:hypothetical protein ACIGW8_34235 [Streptomyces sioyaensis]|uniref:hypothetical protein n=1 Tax=Streptomyces sioyaensis TaxID=67364 RepID=UPI0037D84003